MAIDCLAVWPAAFSIVLFCKGRRVLVVVPYHTPIVTCLDASFSLGVGGGWGSAQILMPRMDGSQFRLSWSPCFPTMGPPHVTMSILGAMG